MNMSGYKWYEKGINFMYVDKWWSLHYLKNCNAAALSVGQRTASLTYNIVNDSDIVLELIIYLIYWGHGLGNCLLSR